MIVDCTDCEWQGDSTATDSGHCPECGAETEECFEVEDDEAEAQVKKEAA